MLRDLWLLSVALWKAATGQTRPIGVLTELPFSPGGQDPESAARRALVVAGVSTAPNTIALGIDSERETLLVHQLSRQLPEPPNRCWPI